jgi:hypothetical protein
MKSIISFGRPQKTTSLRFERLIPAPSPEVPTIHLCPPFVQAERLLVRLSMDRAE